MSLLNKIARLDSYKLYAKFINDHYLQGWQLSRKTGTGVEFDQYRSYQVSDDIRAVDWKYYVRSGKKMVKLSNIESINTINLILDISLSMNYLENDISRLQYAKVMLCSLAYMAYKQQDNIRLILNIDGNLNCINEPGSNDFEKVIYHLENLSSKKNQENNFNLYHLSKKELIIVCSDFLGNNISFQETLLNTADAGHELFIYHILGQKEIDFNLAGTFNFKDLESNTKFHTNVSAIKATYLNNMEAYLKEIQTNFTYKNINYNFTKLNEPIEQVLISSFKKWK